MQEYIWADWATQFSGSDTGSFCQNSDEMKRNRLKVTHRQGLVAQIIWTPVDGHGYTGFYETGFEHGYIRFSQTLPLLETSTGLLPSVAVKALRDGARSQNIFGMPSFHPTESWNFFNTDLINRVEPFDETDEVDKMLLDTIIEKLITGDNQPFSTAIGNFAEFNINTESLDQSTVVSPYELYFRAPDAIKDQMHDELQDPWYADLLTVGKAGTHILDVFVISDPDEAEVKIAEITLDTDLVTSKFGDERFFFQHVRTKRDFKYWSGSTKTTLKALHPLLDEVSHEWDVAEWPTTSEEEAEDYYMDQINTYGCPFAWLLYDSNTTEPALGD